MRLRVRPARLPAAMMLVAVVIAVVVAAVVAVVVAVVALAVMALADFVLPLPVGEVRTRRPEDAQRSIPLDQPVGAQRARSVGEITVGRLLVPLVMPAFPLACRCGRHACGKEQ